MAGTARTFDPDPHDWIELRRALQMIRLQVPLATYDQTTSPTTSDDITKGWKVGSKWVNTSTHVIYECSSNTEGAAIWQQMVGTNATEGGVNSPPGLDGATDYVGVADVSTGGIVRVVLNDLVSAGGGVDSRGEFHLVFFAQATGVTIT